MKTSSAKQKGRRLCAELRSQLLAHAPTLAPDDILVTSSSVTGEDLRLSPRAREILPYTFECKNQEKINIHACMKQAESHAVGTSYAPVLVYSRNRSKTYVSLQLETFLKLATTNKE